jgi:hypothetical protein
MIVQTSVRRSHRTRAGLVKADAVFGGAREAPKLRRLLGLVGAVLSAAIVAAGAAPASASRVDRTSAHMLLADATTYVHTSVSQHLQLEKAVRRFIEHLHSSCPSVLAHAPPPVVEHALGAPPSNEGTEGTPAQRTTSQTFLTMALGELQIVHSAPIRGPALRFATKLARQRWTNPSIAHAVADFGQSLLAILALSPPDFCADARASAATGFALAPPEATQFAGAFRAATGGRSLAELANMMRPFLAGSDLKTLARFQRLWSHAEPLLRINDATVRRLLRTVFHPHRMVPAPLTFRRRAYCFHESLKQLGRQLADELPRGPLPFRIAPAVASPRRSSIAERQADWRLSSYSTPSTEIVQRPRLPASAVASTRPSCIRKKCLRPAAELVRLPLELASHRLLEAGAQPQPV